MPLTEGHACPFSTVTWTFNRVSGIMTPPSPLLCPKVTVHQAKVSAWPTVPRGGIYSLRWGQGCQALTLTIQDREGCPTNGPVIAVCICLHAFVCIAKPYACLRQFASFSPEGCLDLEFEVLSCHELLPHCSHRLLPS